MITSEQSTSILIVEDDKNIAKLIEKKMQQLHYSVDIAYDGERASKKAMEKKYDLIILDIYLPKKSGLEVLKELRLNARATPVLILSAKAEIKDRVQGLQMGADDYLIKPFDVKELLARVDALLRRTKRSNILSIADLTVDIVHRTVRRGETEIELTQKEYALLEYLLRNKNNVVSRRTLTEEVWKLAFDPGTNVVDVYINYLRKSIDKDYSPKLIKTVYGEGFMISDEEEKK